VLVDSGGSPIRRAIASSFGNPSDRTEPHCPRLHECSAMTSAGDERPTRTVSETSRPPKQRSSDTTASPDRSASSERTVRCPGVPEWSPKASTHTPQDQAMTVAEAGKPPLRLASCLDANRPSIGSVFRNDPRSRRLRAARRPSNRGPGCAGSRGRATRHGDPRRQSCRCLDIR
jgi:hypothetical protein